MCCCWVFLFFMSTNIYPWFRRMLPEVHRDQYKNYESLRWQLKLFWEKFNLTKLFFFSKKNELTNHETDMQTLTSINVFVINLTIIWMTFHCILSVNTSLHPDCKSNAQTLISNLIQASLFLKLNSTATFFNNWTVCKSQNFKTASFFEICDCVSHLGQSLVSSGACTNKISTSNVNFACNGSGKDENESTSSKYMKTNSSTTRKLIAI